LGQNNLLRIVVIITIILLSVYILVPSLPFFMRSYSYKCFQSVVKAYLNYQTREFNVLKSENFIIKYTDLDKEIISFTADVIEDHYQSAKTQLSYYPEDEKILVVIYPNQEELNGSFGWEGDKSASGAYWAGSIRLLSPYGWDEDVKEERIIQETLIKVLPISHELSHRLIDVWTQGNYTRWLTEGLAQHIEEKVVGFRLDEPFPKDKETLYSLKNLDRDFDRQENQLLAYWQSLQTVQFLIDKYGMDKMQELLSVLSKGIKTNYAIEQVYGLNINELESKTQEYIQRELLP